MSHVPYVLHSSSSVPRLLPAARSRVTRNGLEARERLLGPVAEIAAVKMFDAENRTQIMLTIIIDCCIEYGGDFDVGMGPPATVI